MKLLIDENIARNVSERLRQDGHTLIMAQTTLHGRHDDEVLAYALQESAIVLTEDTDFGDLVMRQRLPSAGVILLRLSGMPRARQPDHIAQNIMAQANALQGAFTILNRQGIRIRQLP